MECSTQTSFWGGATPIPSGDDQLNSDQQAPNFQETSEESGDASTTCCTGEEGNITSKHQVPTARETTKLAHLRTYVDDLFKSGDKRAAATLVNTLVTT
eukprot:11299419-Heterocapsa_arctica.AAC.1